MLIRNQIDLTLPALN